MDHPYFEMFKQVGHDRLAAPPPVMTKEDFKWESEKTLTKQHLRQILYDEIAMYHPEVEGGGAAGCGDGGSRFAPTASNEVHDQFSALERGDNPARGSTSMPAEQTAPLVEEARGMVYDNRGGHTDGMDQSDDENAQAIPLPGGGGGSAMAMDEDAQVDLAGTVAQHAPARPQTISADDVRKLADSAVASIGGGMDDAAMERAAMSNADQIQLPTMEEGAARMVTRPRGGSRGGAAVTAGRGSRGGAGTRDLLDVMKEKKQQKGRKKGSKQAAAAAAAAAAATAVDSSSDGELDMDGDEDEDDDGAQEEGSGDQCSVM